MKTKGEIIMIKNPTYKFYEFNRQRADGSFCKRVVAVSSFAGQTVKGYADCHPNDKFDPVFGEMLASARCAEKIAAKRCARANAKVDEAVEQMNAAMAHLQKMLKYQAEAAVAHEKAAEYAAFLPQMKEDTSKD
jgi:hypothetical protein